MKLELKHLVYYLPYELNICHSAFMFRDKHNDIETGTMVGLSDIVELNVLGETTFDIIMRRDKDFYKLHDSRGHFKPILRPLSDLKKEEFNYLYTLLRVHIGKNKRDKLINEGYGITDLSYFIFEQLLENHFDLFNLIKDELAIDKNTL